jgi:hypothetical protein
MSLLNGSSTSELVNTTIGWTDAVLANLETNGVNQCNQYPSSPWGNNNMWIGRWPDQVQVYGSYFYALDTGGPCGQSLTDDFFWNGLNNQNLKEVVLHY